LPSALRIPDKLLKDFRVLFDLSDEDRARFRKALQDAPRFAPVSSLVPIVREALGGSSDGAGRALVAVLAATSQVEPPEWTIEKVAEEVAKSGELGNGDDSKIQAAVSFLSGLMELPAIITSAKASDLLTEHDKIFGDARIVTDIRPVFMEDPHELANGVVMVSTLRVQYQDSGGISSFYVALDTEDLVTLRNVVDRALLKIDTLKGRLDDSGLEYFTMDSD
jgi:hypothetical protein